MVDNLRYSVHNVNTRHQFLAKLIGTKPEEDKSVAAVNQLATAVSTSTVAVSLLELGFYFLYNRIVSDKTSTIHTSTSIFLIYRVSQKKRDLKNF